MWQDLATGRPTEVDDLNGEIVRVARSAGIEAPLNRRIVEVVHRYEQRGQGSPRLEPGALAKELGLAATQLAREQIGEPS
jgi:2-dehydropantoate 2-reductase